MEDKKLNTAAMENPTLVLKISSLLSKSWNKELRDEYVHQDTISRLRGNPVQVITAEERVEAEREWPTEQIVNSFNNL
jgi:hypothetical protein